MSSFKIGDIVLVISNKSGAPSSTIGKTGKILDGSKDSWIVEFPQKYNYYDNWCYKDYELTSTYKPPINQTYQFKTGDKVRLKLTSYLPNAAGYNGIVTKTMEEQDTTNAFAFVTLAQPLPKELLGNEASVYFTDLELLPGTPVLGEPYDIIPATNQTKGDLMVYRVTAILTPSVNAQQNGAVESVIIDNETVVANDVNAASLVAGAKNADVITKATGGTIRTRVEGPF